MGEQILFECQLCGSTHETRKGAKIHISNGGDDTHADKKGTDKGVIQEITDTSEFEELNKRTDHEGEERVEVTRGNSTYKGSAT